MVDSKTENKKKFKINLKYSVVPENKEVLQNDGNMSKGYRTQFEGNPYGQIWSNLCKKINKLYIQ